jgi:hypothetical protein
MSLLDVANPSMVYGMERMGDSRWDDINSRWDDV